MSLIKVKQTHLERSVSDKPLGSGKQAWAEWPKENADTEGCCCCSSLLHSASPSCQEVAGGDMGKLE